MTYSVPQLLSLTAIVVGVSLFVITLYSIDLTETAQSVRRLGLAAPLILLPGLAWWGSRREAEAAGVSREGESG